MERYYSVREVHEATGIPLRTIYEAVQGGLLRTVTPNGASRGMRTTEAWVKEWLEGRKS